MISGAHHENDDPIEAYLDDLLAALRGTARDIRRSIAECEAHLREGVERRVASGSTRRRRQDRRWKRSGA